jgi:homoserine dehydrogenase
MDKVETAVYLRLTVEDKPGVLAKVTGILGDSGISIEAVKQKEPLAGETEVPLVLLTHRVLEGDMDQALAIIEAMDTVRSISRIRVEYLD